MWLFSVEVTALGVTVGVATEGEGVLKPTFPDLTSEVGPEDVEDEETWNYCGGNEDSIMKGAYLLLFQN